MAASLKSRFPEIIAELRPRVGAAVKATAEHIEKGAKDRVPIGPPDVHLYDDIRVERRGPAEYAVAAGRENTFYASWVEFGTSHSSPQPFLIPAAEEGVPVAEALVTAALRGL